MQRDFPITNYRGVVEEKMISIGLKLIDLQVKHSSTIILNICYLLHYIIDEF